MSVMWSGIVQELSLLNLIIREAYFQGSLVVKIMEGNFNSNWTEVPTKYLIFY